MRVYHGSRSFSDLVDYVEDQKWQNDDPVPWWRSPTATQYVVCFECLNLLTSRMSHSVLSLIEYLVYCICIPIVTAICPHIQTHIHTYTHTHTHTHSMRAIGIVFWLSEKAKDLQVVLEEKYELPTYAVFIVIAVATIVVGLSLGGVCSFNPTCTYLYGLGTKVFPS